MQNLNELFLLYGSDKASHEYGKFYEKYLPENINNLLEIGVKNGASIRAWLHYYPSAIIFGLDLFEENNMPEDLINNERVKLIKGNQCDYLLLEELRKYDFDVIIDDGSHNARDQMITFFGLFNGKHYFIEDTHCNYEDFYSQGLPELFRASNILDDARIYNNHLKQTQGFDGIAIDFSNDGNGEIICIECIKSL